MELLFRRDQTRGAFGRVKFKLWAKTELGDEETELVSRYRFDKAVLIAADQPKLLRNTLIVMVVVFVLAFLLLSVLKFLTPAGTEAWYWISGVVGVIAGSVYLHRRYESRNNLSSIDILKGIGIAAIVGGLMVLPLFAPLNNRLMSAVAVVVAVVWGFGYFHEKRETIFVRDLLHGRYFSCTSVIDLARTEAWLETIVGFLRQVMESAKHWDGTESHTIEALPKDEARSIIIKGI